MKKFVKGILLVLPLSACGGLSGDTAKFISDAQQSAKNACGFLPTVEVVVNIASLVSPSSASSAISSAVDTAKKICDEVKKDLALNGFRSSRGTLVTVGEIEGVAIEGYFVE